MEGCVIKLSEFSQPLDQVEAIFTILSMRGKGVGRGRDEEPLPRAALPSVRPSVGISKLAGRFGEGREGEDGHARGRAGARLARDQQCEIGVGGEWRAGMRCGD